MNRIFTIHMSQLLLYNMSIFSTISTPTLLQADGKFLAGGLYESTAESNFFIVVKYEIIKYRVGRIFVFKISLKLIAFGMDRDSYNPLASILPSASKAVHVVCE